MRGAAAALPTGQALGLYGSTIFVEFVTFGAVLTAMPFILFDEYGTSPLVVGAVITANLLVSAVVSANNGRFASRVSERQLIALGFVMVGIGLLVSWTAGGPIEFGVAAMIFGSGYGLIFPSVDSSITTIAPASYRAGALSLRNSATFLGRGTGPLLFALAATAIGYRPVLAVSAGVSLAVGVGGNCTNPRMNKTGLGVASGYAQNRWANR